jgi:hypothetical protein
VPTNETLDERLARYHRETMRAVAPPGAAVVRRTVLRRQRRRVALAGVAAVVAIASAIGIARFAPIRVSPVNPDPSTSVTVSVGPTPPGSTSSTTPSTGTSPSASSPPPSSSSSSAGGATDLHVTAPTSVTLQSDGTVYRGQFDIKVTNSGTGPPGPSMQVFLAVPTGVDFGRQADSGLGLCLTAAPPENWSCNPDAVPAGGTVTLTVRLVANYAPRATELIIDGLTLRFATSSVTDPTPADNKVAIRIVLPAT